MNVSVNVLISVGKHERCLATLQRGWLPHARVTGSIIWRYRYWIQRASRRRQCGMVDGAHLAIAITSNGSNREGRRSRDMEKQQRLNELADFLRTRRARLRPEDIDFPSGSRRKTPGLRREEVAERAGISVTWYAWLEQGREVNVSFKTIE